MGYEFGNYCEALRRHPSLYTLFVSLNVCLSLHIFLFSAFIYRVPTPLRRNACWGCRSKLKKKKPLSGLRAGDTYFIWKDGQRLPSTSGPRASLF